jgi:TetR/AcrR family transcriptional regulator
LKRIFLLRGPVIEEIKIPRRERERLRKRKEILAEALALFSEKGYHNVSMAEIAEKAEFAIGTLYNFFKNKEDLYNALMLELADKFHEALTMAIHEPQDEIEKLRNYVRAKGDIFRANVAMIRLYFAQTRGASINFMAGLDSEIRKRRYAFMQDLASIFERGMKRKQFKKIAAPYHLAIALDSLTNAFLFLWLEAPEHHPYPEDPDTIVNIIFKGLVDS